MRQDSNFSGNAAVDSDWIGEHVLAGPDDRVCLWFDQPVTRATLREMVAERSE